MEREGILEALTELIEMEDASKVLAEDTHMEEVIFDSITKLGILAFLDTYAAKKRTVQEVLDCEKISDLIDLVY